MRNLLFIFLTTFLLLAVGCGESASKTDIEAGKVFESSGAEILRLVPDAGEDQTIHIGEVVTLDASATVATGTLTYSWVFQNKPENSMARIVDPTSEQTSFLADIRGTYIISINVKDTYGYVESATVTIVVENTAPVANAGPNQNIRLENVAQLDGNSSYDADGDSITYHWSLISKPNGSTATLSSQNTVNPVFLTDVMGTYIVQLTTNDGSIESPSSTVTIIAGNLVPIADAGADEEALSSNSFLLDGGDSYGVYGDLLSYRWTISSKPIGSSASLSNPSTATPTLHTDVEGSYSIALIVNDGYRDSIPEYVVIKITVPVDFNMSLDVNESDTTANWKISSNTFSSATTIISTQGRYGTFVIHGDHITYLKTEETTAVDIAILDITLNGVVVQSTVTLNSLYWKRISSGDERTVAIKSDGTLWAWGNNMHGQLGDGTTQDKLNPTQESSAATNWSSVSAGGSHTVAIKSDGTLWSWGKNNNGELGDGTTEDKLTPTQESNGATNWASVSAGKAHTVAIKNDGTLWAWGDNNYAQLGDGTAVDKPNPTQESSGATNWSSVNARSDFSVAIKANGTLWGWGDNYFGQLGDGTKVSRLNPTQESSGSMNWAHVNAGEWHTAAIKNDGSLWTWGRNTYGTLGDGTIADKVDPTQESSGATNWSSVSAGDKHTVGIKADGSLWSWGDNSFGQLGDGTTKAKHNPTQESSLSMLWSHVSAGSDFTIGIKSNGTLWSWGDNSRGQLGNGITTDVLHPTQERSGASNWSSISVGLEHTSAIKSDGTLWSWGNNARGQLGDGVSVDKSNPVQESSKATNWSIVSAGEEHTVAIKADGTLWSWGANSNGELGDGTTDDKLNPTQESSGATNWTGADAGSDFTVGIKSDGTLWAWGDNYFSQLGDGTDTDKPNPTQESTGARDWTRVSTGSSHVLAVKNDGTLWSWGYNYSGQLGNGTTLGSASPAQEGSGATDWSSISAGGAHSVGIKSDGTLWSWGSNYYTQLGDATSEDKPNPTQERSGATNWSSMSAGATHTIAIKADGTLWSWGHNKYGALGDGTTIDKSSPIQESSKSTDWSSVGGGGFHSIALKSDGTLWSWGSNSYGQVYELTIAPTQPQLRK